MHLPRTLWEIGTNNLATTQVSERWLARVTVDPIELEAILGLLLRLLQRGSFVMQREVCLRL